jgi:hypothetical protein
MKVKMKSLAGGPDGYLRPDKCYDVPTELGRQMVNAHDAELDGPEAEAEYAEAQARFESEGAPVAAAAETTDLKSKRKRA